MIGSTANVDGVVYTILIDRYSSSCKVRVWVGDESNQWANKAEGKFSADGTSVTFTYGGINYTATVVDDALTVTEA